ncbi:hypothetical protein [Mammaliicoccus sciuri]|uniref:hypothetical protein n=1 Tax=Mammaliicoccus sciuri TaxID=1296 RepID=UPI000D1DE541|nr:hypothetical protein [Mammaliicoccus sciuri]MCD8800622.1 hypothetical protein [Mammaliicoccus sciuri]PTJ74250.1 hypothetical protein BU008_02045 [Mammaliicoccus sciuri]
MSQVLIALKGNNYFLANEDLTELYDKIKNIKNSKEKAVLVFGRFVNSDEQNYDNGSHTTALLMVDKIIGWRTLD